MRIISTSSHSTFSPPPQDMLSVRMETVSIKQEESLAILNPHARLALAAMLDQTSDWRRLCHLMKLQSLEGGFATFSSPTKDLLTMYEVRLRGHRSSVCALIGGGGVGE